MFKKVFIFFILNLSLFANVSTVQKFNWPNGKTFLHFLEDSNIPSSLYYDLSQDDKELATEIGADVECEMLVDEDGNLEQILIPITEELQIHIFKDEKNKFNLTFTPTIFTQTDNTLGLNVETMPYLDINNATGDGKLAAAFTNAFKGRLNFSRLQKGDQIAINYTQRFRLGKPYGSPQILSAMIEENKKSNYIYYFESKFYDENGKISQNFLFKLPIPGARVSSKFTPKRYHPVLKRYRAHLGTDYAAPRGTAIKAVGSGTVVFVGNKGGYGKTLEIQHQNGYKSLYAHLNGFAKGMKKGRKILQGDIVAFVGNTGMSTGPHLHLGLYKNNKAMDFEKVVKVAKENIELEKEEKKRFKKYIKSQNEILQMAMGGYHNPSKFIDFENFIEF